MAYGEIQFTFNDLPLTVNIDGIVWRIADVDGVATIGFDRDGGWWIGTVELSVDRKIADRKYATGYFEPSKYAPWLYEAVKLALRADRSDEIQESVNREFEGAGRIIHSDIENNTLNHRQLGLMRRTA